MVKMSIIIPTFNEENCLEETLKTIDEQEFKDYEIIIADGESTDKTLEIAKKYTDKIFSSKDKSVASGRNKVLPKTKGNIIVFVDADVRLYPGVFSKINEIMKNKEISAGFFYNEPWDGNFIDKIIYKIVCASTNILNPLGATIALGPCMFFRKKVLMELKGFNEEVILDDVEIFKRLKRKKYKTAVVKKPVKVSARKLSKQNRIKYAINHIKIWLDVLKGKKETRVHHEVYKPIR